MEGIERLRGARRRRRLRQWAQRVAPGGLGLVATGALVLVLDPAHVARAVQRFQLALLPAILVLYLLIYGLQGLRWHQLLGEAGVKLRLGDSLLLNAAGQTITALVPLGDLTRALFAAQASKQEFGRVAATVTVQELSYTLMLLLFALPVLVALHLGLVFVVLTAAAMAAIVVILTVSPVFCAVHQVVARIPLLRRLLPAIEELQHETADLLHRPDTLAWSILDLCRAACSVAVFWLIVQGLAPGSLGWWKAGFVVAVASIGGAVSLIPGGVGANEASVAGLLLLFGEDAGAAGAAALLQRVLMTVSTLIFGVSAYAVARRRFALSGVFQVRAGESRRRAA